MRLQWPRLFAAKVLRGVRPLAHCPLKALLTPPIGQHFRAMQRRPPSHINRRSSDASDLYGPSQSRRCPVNSVVAEPLLRVPPMADLPPPNTKRWVVRRKAAVVAAVRSGKITMEEALHRYQLTEEEFLSWQRAFEGHGLPGLHATRLQQYREPRSPRGPRSRR